MSFLYDDYDQYDQKLKSFVIIQKAQKLFKSSLKK